MTQEQKAKAYDEALERARKQRDEYQKEFDKTDKDSRLASILRAAISAVEMAFPELAESEDERIRKALIDALKTSKSVGELKFVLPEPTRKDCIAYIEKQKEQKHPDGCFTCDEYKKGYEAGRLNGFTAGYNKAMKEQKPAKCELEDAFKYYTDRGITISCGDLRSNTHISYYAMKDTAK